MRPGFPRGHTDCPVSPRRPLSNRTPEIPRSLGPQMPSSALPNCRELREQLRTTPTVPTLSHARASGRCSPWARGCSGRTRRRSGARARRQGTAERHLRRGRGTQPLQPPWPPATPTQGHHRNAHRLTSDRHNVAQPQGGILFSHQREQILTCATAPPNLEDITPREAGYRTSGLVPFT